jgi:hypothetical protein
MPDLSSLNLTEDMFPSVDWDAPEGGKTPPAVYPGSYKLLFGLLENKDDWFTVEEREVVKGQPKRKILEVHFQPKVIADAAGRVLANEDGSQIQLGPQKVSTYQSPKMRIHSLAELLRSMGVRDIDLKTQLESTLVALDGKGVIESAEIVWRTYFKSTGVTVSTAPNKKKGDLPWPRDAQGNPELMATEPSTGEKAYAYAEVVRYHQAAEATESAAVAG